MANVKNGKWKPEFVIQVYELVKSGMSETSVSKVIGVSVDTFRRWGKKKTHFGLAIKAGRKVRRVGKNGGLNFQDYVFKRLSGPLRKIWRKINRLDEAKSGVEKIEALLDKGGVRVRQHLFIYAWVRSNFSISYAMRKLNISRSVFNKWKNKDREFAALVDEINWHKLNFFEDHFTSLVAGGCVPATIHGVKTMCRSRGYGDKLGLDITGTVEVNQNIIFMDDLGLSVKVKKIILKAIRKNAEREAS